MRAGLSALGTAPIFALDATFSAYRANLEAARAEALDKYALHANYSDVVDAAVNAWFARRLAAEYPQNFLLSNNAREVVLSCRHTEDTLAFDTAWHFRGEHSTRSRRGPAYASGLDALASQVPEDIAVVCRDGERHWIGSLHVCCPNYWSPAAKIGRDFSAIHEPVAGIDRVTKHANQIVQLMITRGPFVRAALGLSSDTQLNHHPEPPIGISPHTWHGRGFSVGGALYLRVERQTTFGLPEVGAAIFTIRTYFVDCRTLAPPAREELSAAIHALTEEQLRYKGLRGYRDVVLQALAV